VVITESSLRLRFAKDKSKQIMIRPGDILTPPAKDYIREHGIALVVDGADEAVMPQPFPDGFVDEDGRQYAEKPEHMTHLHGNVLVDKGHPRIAFRGSIDLLQAAIINAQCVAEVEKRPEILGVLQELLDYARELLGCEVRGCPFTRESLLGKGQAWLREESHHPEKHFGVRHLVPDYRMGPTMAQLNLVRTLTRQTELAAVCAFPGDQRLDLIRALNRMSSAVYILECRLMADIIKEKGWQPWMKSW